MAATDGRAGGGGGVMAEDKVEVALVNIQGTLSELQIDLKMLTTLVVGGTGSNQPSLLMRLTLAERKLAQVEAKQAENEQLRVEFNALKNRILGAAAVLSFLSMGVGGLVVRLVG